MTELLSKAIRAVEALDAAEQDKIAEAILSLAHADEFEEIDPEHLREIQEGLAEISRGELATDEEVQAAFRSFAR
jgi:predicted transcriptional regulator